MEDFFFFFFLREHIIFLKPIHLYSLLVEIHLIYKAIFKVVFQEGLPLCTNCSSNSQSDNAQGLGWRARVFAGHTHIELIR